MLSRKKCFLISKQVKLQSSKIISFIGTKALAYKQGLFCFGKYGGGGGGRAAGGGAGFFFI